ncbi:hypothetical protein GCM10023149_51060 [Mucilaginibacter gynuensis]|uniref:Uncharacterized protein n=1 Tax=Mucilaginibacter gynuensis TaxID=1302236 RepID=A0ABP8HIU8_9SPHI
MTKFEQSVPQYVTGNLPADQLPAVAILGLQDGFDSSSLWILAGLGKNELTPDIEKYYYAALKELNIAVPDLRLATLQYALIIVRQIINGEKDIVDGIAEIHYKVLRRYDFWSEIKNYVYDSIYFNTLYGLLVTYEDLQYEHVEGVADKSEEMNNVKAEMHSALIEWNDVMKSYPGL